MSIRTALILMAMMLACVGISMGQKRGKAASAQGTALGSTDAIQISVAPIGHKRSENASTNNDPERFKAGSNIPFELVMTNTSLNPVTVLVWDTYVQNRPQLYRDDQLVSYRKEINEMLAADKDESDFLRMDRITLEPNHPKAVETIRLGDWYEPLEPGHYQLSVRHQCQASGTWIESSPIIFEVDPK